MRKHARGGRAWFHDQRDGLRKRYTDMVFDGQYPGLRVARDTYDPAHPQEVPMLDIADPQGLEFGTGDMDVIGVTVRFPALQDGVGPNVLSMANGSIIVSDIKVETG